MQDIEIAKNATMMSIDKVANEFGINEEEIELYGKYKAKISYNEIFRLNKNEDGRLILVTAVNPTPQGEGKTTVSIGLADAMNIIGEKTVLALREPSLGPCFGLKGGAAGGGHSQLVPMDELNLHFTGDFHAITYANNLLASLIDNHIQHGNELKIDSRRILFKRCIDLNDRVLRNVVIGLGNKADGFVREDHFTITVASEIMAILCLSSDINDLRRRLSNIVVAYDYNNNEIYAKDLNAVGSMLALLKDAFKPNIIQTLNNNLALVHGGPFANIAHGCNSIVATKLALKIGRYAITEAGFGADLGAEKFLDIKCRVAGLKPSCIIIVATIKSIKYNANISAEELDKEDIAAIEKGIVNLKKHIQNIRKFGYEPIVAINKFPTDTDREIEKVVQELDTKVFEVEVHSKGGKGAISLAKYIQSLDLQPHLPEFLYDLDDSLENKIRNVVEKVYGADKVEYSQKISNIIKKIDKSRASKFHICIAKTQYSFSDNPKLLGAPEKFTINIRDVYVNYGAEMIIVVTGNIVTMPGLPKIPLANNIDIDENGEIVGLN